MPEAIIARGEAGRQRSDDGRKCGGVLRIGTSVGELAVDVSGQGPAVLCLHGISGNRSTWRALNRHLSPDLTLIAPDLIGRGESEIRAGLCYDLAAEVRRVAELIETLALDRLVVVGHSQGAAIALGLAKQSPAVAGLVLANPVTPWTKRPTVLSLPGLRDSLLIAHAMKWFRNPLTKYILERRVLAAEATAPPETVMRYAEPFRDPDRARTLLSVVVDWQPRDLLEWLPERRLSSTVIVGGHDRRTPARDAARLSDMTLAELVLVPRTGHALPEERPGLLTSIIEDLVARLRLPTIRIANRKPT